MSDSNRGKFDYVGLLGALAIILPVYAVMIWQMSAEQARHQVEATYAARDYAQSTDAQIRDLCVGGTLQSRMECATEIIAANRESERGERDLEAQQAMARWTQVMGAIAGAGLLISFIGVILVFITFRETRRAADAGFQANAISRDLGQAQVKAYISIGGARISPNIGQPSFSIQFDVINSGQSPTVDLTCRITTRWMREALLNTATTNVIERPLNDVSASTSKQMEEFVHFPELALFSVNDFRDLNAVHVEIIIEGFDVFGSEVSALEHFTKFWRPDEIRFGYHQLTFANAASVVRARREDEAS